MNELRENLWASWCGERYSSSYYGGRQPWVARLTGIDERWGFKREFIQGIYDYSHGKRHHTRGVFIYWALPPGLYEFSRPKSWKHHERFFGRVTETGQIVQMSREEMIECLKECSE